VTASIGASLFPSDADNEVTLTKNAEAAMYAAKQAGRDTYLLHSEEIKTQSNERLMLETGLRRALERNEFVLHYQPKRDLKRDGIFRRRRPAALAASGSRIVAAQPVRTAR
jgi:predicted signal transduction protein with EAL and GGDEF domain